MPYLIECQDCGFVQYRMRSGDMEDTMAQRSIMKGIFPCHQCKKKTVKFRNIKWKRLKILRKLFPNKKVIYTNLDYEEIIQHPDEDTQPYIMWEKNKSEQQ